MVGFIEAAHGPMNWQNLWVAEEAQGPSQEDWCDGGREVILNK